MASTNFLSVPCRKKKSPKRMYCAYARNSSLTMTFIMPMTAALIPELLSYLQNAGVQIAVASNKYQAATQKLVDHYFPEIHFTAVFGQREGVKVKPDPIIVSDILEVAKVAKEEVLYVGDSGVDMQTAANAGVTACGVTWGFRPRTELEEFNPSYIADTAGEIKKLIL